MKDDLKEDDSWDNMPKSWKKLINSSPPYSFRATLIYEAHIESEKLKKKLKQRKLEKEALKKDKKKMKDKFNHDEAFDKMPKSIKEEINSYPPYSLRASLIYKAYIDGEKLKQEQKQRKLEKGQKKMNKEIELWDVGIDFPYPYGTVQSDGKYNALVFAEMFWEKLDRCNTEGKILKVDLDTVKGVMSGSFLARSLAIVAGRWLEKHDRLMTNDDIDIKGDNSPDFKEVCNNLITLAHNI